LKLQEDEPLSNFAFDFDMHPYIKAKFRKATALHRLGRSDGAR
jgi:hypothetical protein